MWQSSFTIFFYLVRKLIRSLHFSSSGSMPKSKHVLLQAVAIRLVFIIFQHLETFLNHRSLLQELCLDINNPNGMGRRRKRSSFSGFVEPIQKSTSELVQRRRNFFPVDPDDQSTREMDVEVKSRSNSSGLQESKANMEEFKGQSTKIDENVSLTVLIPGGKYKTLVPIEV